MHERIILDAENWRFVISFLLSEAHRATAFFAQLKGVGSKHVSMRWMDNGIGDFPMFGYSKI